MDLCFQTGPFAGAAGGRQNPLRDIFESAYIRMLIFAGLWQRTGHGYHWAFSTRPKRWSTSERIPARAQNPPNKKNRAVKPGFLFLAEREIIEPKHYTLGTIKAY